MNIAIPIIAGYIYKDSHGEKAIGILHPDHKNIEDSKGEIYPFGSNDGEYYTNEDIIIKIRYQIKYFHSDYYSILYDKSRIIRPIYINKIKEEKYLKSQNS